MSTRFSNAKIFLGGIDLTGQSNRVALEYFVEPLDSTTFGGNTRTKAGGLKVSRATGGGFWRPGTGQMHEPMYESVGVSDLAFVAFPDDILEGSTSCGSGYGFKVVTGSYEIGGMVGELLPFSFEAEGRGTRT